MGSRFSSTVEPRSTDTRLIWTPVYNGVFRLSRRKAHIFSLKLTRLRRTPVNTDNFPYPYPTDTFRILLMLYVFQILNRNVFSFSASFLPL